MTRPSGSGGLIAGASGPRDDAPGFDAGSRARASMVRRLRRIEGQVRGLERMVEMERDGAEILMQIASAREALHAAATIILESYLVASAEAVLLAENDGDRERLTARITEVFKIWAT